MQITDTGDHIVLEKEEYAQLKRGIDDRDFTIDALRKKELEHRQFVVWAHRVIETIGGNFDKLRGQVGLMFAEQEAVREEGK